MSSFLFRRSAIASASAARSFSTSSPLSIARITIVGNLADTPELHSTSTGREILRYVVASNSGTRENRKTSWFKVTSFSEGGSRDFLMSLPKGTQVVIEGDISTSSYTDPQGVQRTGISVVQRSLDVLRRPQHAAESAESSEHSQ
ncbi:hypothetical protein BGZ63DRAFT_109583 [Mariannaea sp. PMI_226]|nr:hypothetical protein BGZ63DRAFT_109583 [Mariannaea sp. PMI_226]